MLKWFRNKKTPWKVLNHEVKIYPNGRSCVKPNMNHVKPEQMPPLMVRKAGWRR